MYGKRAWRSTRGFGRFRFLLQQLLEFCCVRRLMKMRRTEVQHTILAKRFSIGGIDAAIKVHWIVGT